MIAYFKIMALILDCCIIIVMDVIPGGHVCSSHPKQTPEDTVSFKVSSSRVDNVMLQQTSQQQNKTVQNEKFS